jgi:hypothetical protein
MASVNEVGGIRMLSEQQKMYFHRTLGQIGSMSQAMQFMSDIMDRMAQGETFTQYEYSGMSFKLRDIYARWVDLQERASQPSERAEPPRHEVIAQALRKAEAAPKPVPPKRQPQPMHTPQFDPSQLAFDEPVQQDDNGHTADDLPPLNRTR